MGDLDSGHLDCEEPNPVLDPIAWFCGNDGGMSPERPGLLGPNGWGLFDMLGNVRELCHDWYAADLGTAAAVDPWGPATGTNRVARGGSRAYQAWACRAANRASPPPATAIDNDGFRPVRSFPP
jgi:formylglycine-generating enzyme required for sulfatase activity